MPKVSIIVPMYNSEKFLDRCIQSLINQTLKDIEIILVNDASPDNSLDLARNYEKQDFRITVIDLPHNIVASRNEGIKIAKGEYLGFVDADDWVEPNMYEELYQKTQNCKIDVVIGGIRYCYESGEIISEQQFEKCEEDTLVIKRSLAQYGGRLFTNIWKRTLITEDILFLEHNLYCDAIVSLWYLKAESFAIVRKDLYNYYINDNSITHRKNSFSMFDRLESAQDFLNRSKTIGLYNLYPSEINYIYYRLYFKNTILQIGKIFTKVPMRKVAEFREHFISEIDIKNNKYFQLHKNEKSEVVARLVMSNFYFGIIVIQFLIIYFFICDNK